MSGIVLVYLLVTFCGGGTSAAFTTDFVLSTSTTYQNFTSSTTTTTTASFTPTSTPIPDVSVTANPVHQPLLHHHQHHHHRHRSRPAPSPFTSSGLAVVNRCTLAVQIRSRRKLQKWSDEYLIRPLTIQQLKPDVLNLPHKIGGLFSRTGVWSEMVNEKSMPNRDESWLESYRIRGTRNVDSRYALMEFYSIAVGLISIRGLETKDFLCMNAKGELYPASVDNYTIECIFTEEVLDNYYNIYSSCAHGYPEKQWHVAFKHSGVPKKGRHVSKSDIGAQFIVKELNKDFWVPPQVSEEPPKSRSGFDDDGFNWFEKVTNKWQDLTQERIQQPTLMRVDNIDSKLLGKYYDVHSRQFPPSGNYYPSSREIQEFRTEDNFLQNDDDLPFNQNDLKSKTVQELSRFMERKKRRMHREERRRKHRRKELNQLRKYSRSNMGRHNHSKSLTNRLQNLPTN